MVLPCWSRCGRFRWGKSRACVCVCVFFFLLGVRLRAVRSANTPCLALVAIEFPRGKSCRRTRKPDTCFCFRSLFAFWRTKKAVHICLCACFVCSSACCIRIWRKYAFLALIEAKHSLLRLMRALSAEEIELGWRKSWAVRLF